MISGDALKMADNLNLEPGTVMGRAEGQEESLFQSEWWLQAAAPKTLEWSEVFWSGETVARLPFVRTRRMGFHLLDMPSYTRTLEPILRLPASKPAKRVRNMHRAVSELIANLPPHDRYQATLRPNEESAFSLALAGCSLGQNFTFRMPARWNVEQHWEDLDQKTRNLIRTAAKELEVRCDTELEPLLQLSHAERGRGDRTEAETLGRLTDAARARGQMATLTARTDDGRIAAVAILVWDTAVLYFWQSSRNPAVERSGANSLLVWEAMRMAQRKGLIFDVDGYHTATAARFVGRFGLLPEARTTVLHMSRLGRRVQAVGRLLGRGSGFGVQPLGAGSLEE